MAAGQGTWNSPDERLPFAEEDARDTAAQPDHLPSLPSDPPGAVGPPEEVEPPWLEAWLVKHELTEDAARPDHLSSGMLASLEPGLFLAAELESIDPRTVDEYHLVEMVAGYHRIAAWAHGRMTEVAASLSRRPALNPRRTFPTGDEVMNVAAEELSPRLGLSRFAVKRLVEIGQLFSLKLEDTGAALQLGLIDYPKACAIARHLKDQPDDVAWEVQQIVLPDATHQTITQLEKALAKAIISVDPLRATARHRAAREQRRVNHPRPLPDGMASILAILPATDAAGLDLALEAAARTAKANGDTRTIDQLRADALALLGHGALEHGFIGAPETAPSPGDDADAAEPDPPADGAPPADATSADGSPPVGSAPADDSPPPAGATASGDDGPPPADGTGPSTGDDGPPPADGTAPSTADDGPPPVDGTAPADDAPPVMQTGNSFLRTPHMPVGTIGGRRAQVSVTVPLSVLIPFAEDDDHPCEGDSCAHQRPPSPPQPEPGSRLGSDGCRCRCRCQTPSEDELDLDEVGFPEDWYCGSPAEVAELDGYGPITPDVARGLAHSGGTWRRLVTDPLSGALLDVGRSSYRPPAPIADFVRHRDGTCVWLTCSSPARSAQLDHVVPWEFGGVTSADNLDSLCATNHPVKTIGAFELRHLGGGTFEWTTPTGHHYIRHNSGRITALGRRAAANDAVSRAAQDAPPY